MDTGEFRMRMRDTKQLEIIGKLTIGLDLMGMTQERMLAEYKYTGSIITAS